MIRRATGFTKRFDAADIIRGTIRYDVQRWPGPAWIDLDRPLGLGDFQHEP